MLYFGRIRSRDTYTTSNKKANKMHTTPLTGGWRMRTASCESCGACCRWARCRWHKHLGLPLSMRRPISIQQSVWQRSGIFVNVWQFSSYVDSIRPFEIMKKVRRKRRFRCTPHCTSFVPALYFFFFFSIFNFASAHARERIAQIHTKKFFSFIYLIFIIECQSDVGTQKKLRI